MSFNVSNTLMIATENEASGALRVDADLAGAWLKAHEDDLPEGHFFDDFDWNNSAVFYIEEVPWHGEGSGRSIELLYDFLELTKGFAEFILIWEDGSSFSGVRVRDGVVTRDIPVVLSLASERT